MKKKILSLFTIFALTLIIGGVAFSESAKASGNPSVVGEFTESFRIDQIFTFNPNKQWEVLAQNYSFEDAVYLVRIYKSGTNTILFEAAGFVPGRTTEQWVNSTPHLWYTPSKDNHYYDFVVYRKGNMEVLGQVSSIR